MVPSYTMPLNRTSNLDTNAVVPSKKKVVSDVEALGTELVTLVTTGGYKPPANGL